jgi:hypothetical protein
MRLLIALILALSLSGCSLFRLTENTIDVSSTIGEIYTRQALSNLSKYIDEPNAIPSQTDLTAGTIQTQNAVTPSMSGPLSDSVTKNGLGVVTQTVKAAVNLNVNVNDGWQQNWNVAPVTEANELRNLRALYRYALGYTDEEEFLNEYLISRKFSDGQLKTNMYYLLLPHCVICMRHRNDQPFVNPRLKRNWLYYSVNGTSREKSPPPGERTVFLGHYASHNLYMREEDFRNGVLADFVLFLLPQSEPSEPRGERDGRGGGDRGNRNRRRDGAKSMEPPVGIQPLNP